MFTVIFLYNNGNEQNVVKDKDFESNGGIRIRLCELQEMF